MRGRARGELLAGLDVRLGAARARRAPPTVAAVLAALASRPNDDLRRGDRAGRAARIDHEPLCRGGAPRLIRLLARSGDRPAALVTADAWRERLRRELDAAVGDTRRWSRRSAAGASLPPRRGAAPPADRRWPRTGRPGPRGPLRRLARRGPTRLRGHAAVRGRHRRAGDRQDDAARRARAARARRRRRGPVRAQRRAGAAALSAVGRGARAAPRCAAARRARAPPRRRRARAPAAVARRRDDAARRRARGSATRRALPRVRGCARAARGGRRRAAGSARPRRPALGRPRLAAPPPPPRADGARRTLLVAISCARPSSRRRGRGARRPAARRPAVQLELAGLDEDAVAAVLARREATADAAAYRERTGGNPFFLDELLRDEAEDGDGDRPAAGRPRGDRRAGIARLPSTRALRAAGGRRPGPRVRAARADHARRVVDGLHAAVGGGPAPASASAVRVRPRADRGDLLRRHDALAPGVPAPADRGRARRPTGAARRARSPSTSAPPARSRRRNGRVAAELAAAREAEAMLAYADAAAHYEAALA